MRKTNRLFSFVRPWRGILIFVAVLASLFAIDSAMKRAPHPGFWPEDATWLAQSRDLPDFWRQLAAAPYLRDARNDLRADLNDLSLGIYRIAGIRPTAQRCRAWLGNNFAAAISPGGAGICVKPGLLLRARMAAARSPKMTNGVCVFGDYYYAWRDGFFIAGTTPEYIEKALHAPPADSRITGGGLLVQRKIAPEFTVEFRPDDNAQLLGHFAGEIAKRSAPLELAARGDNLAVVVASHPGDVANLLAFFGNLVSSAFPRISETAVKAGGSVLSAWDIATLPDNWDRNVSEVAAFLSEIETDQTVPVPVGGLVMRNAQPVYLRNPFEALAGDKGIPYEWRGACGLMIPWLGEKLTLCLATWEKDWIITTREKLMAKTIGQYPARTLSGDAFVAVDLRRAAGDALKILTKAADLELIRGMNQKDALDYYGPRFNALGRLGTIEVQCTTENDGVINFTGTFVQ